MAVDEQVCDPEDTVEEVLNKFAGTFKQDEQMQDLAILTERTVELLRKEDARTAAVGLITELRDKLHQARRMGRYVKEAGVVERMTGRMNMDESYSLSSPVGPSIDQQDNPQLAEMLKQIQQADKESKPYEFLNTCEATEMTVNIPVPAETHMKDVKCKITSKTIRVEVKGHAVQPCVIDGSFFQAVEEDAFDFHLEGSGDKRILVLDLEKVKEGAKWPDLLGFGAK